MKQTTVSTATSISVKIQPGDHRWMLIGGGREAVVYLGRALHHSRSLQVHVVSEDPLPEMETLVKRNPALELQRRAHRVSDFHEGPVIIATGNDLLDESIASEAKQAGAWISVPSQPSLGDFIIMRPVKDAASSGWFQRNTDQPWKNLASRLMLAFLLMIIGHIVISYLPLPSLGEIWTDTKPYFDKHFIFFMIAGFLAQMVDGMLSMGYGVTSATCLMSFGVSPVSVSAAIHTSEIFTTGISGYSHYRFGNVNKKLFRHLVIPGVIGAVLGALMLVYLGERYSKYLMPVIALYAGFLGLKILFKAFQKEVKGRKVKRIGWLAAAGGFFDSFGGGGWGPIVTSSLISKGRSPKYTVGSVSLTEFFVTLSSAFTFFLTVGVQHWNVVLGLIAGGAIAAPLAARLAGKLPRKTMLILVGVMVMIWCARMFIKSVF